MAKLEHENVVRFYGISHQSGTNDLLVVYEYMDLGDLKSYLRERGMAGGDTSRLECTLQVRMQISSVLAPMRAPT